MVQSKLTAFTQLTSQQQHIAVNSYYLQYTVHCKITSVHMSTDNVHHTSCTEIFNIINNTYLLTAWSIVLLEKLTGFILYNIIKIYIFM